ncbi:hypothetical protein JCM8547_007761 [Rhodosporidiobolus lusitaniae]
MPAPSTEREHRLSGASEAQDPPRGRRASSPPATRPSRLRESVSRFDSINSNFPSITSTSTRQSVDSTQSGAPADSGPKKKRRDRPRPANLAGPSIPPRQLSNLQRSEDRTPGSSMNGSMYASSESGEKEKGDKPLFAMGGVFPKHETKQRRESRAEQQKPRMKNSDDERRRQRAKHWQARLRDGDEEYASSGALDTGSSFAPSSAGHSAGGHYERGDPFEDLEKRQSKLDPVISQGSHRSSASLASRASRRSRASGEQLAEGDEPNMAGSHDLEKQRSGSSRTVAETDEAVDALPEGEEKTAHSSQEFSDDPGEESDGGLSGRTGREPGTKGQHNEGGDQGPVGGQLNQDKDQWEHDFDQADDLPIRNWWGTVRFALREPLAEFLGTLALVVIGIGSDCQTKISQNTMGAYQSMNWAWGLGVMTSIYIAGGVSGGHTNPAVTLVLALFRGFPWKMVPRYIFAQIFGAFCGALIIYGNYKRAIQEYDSEKLIYATTTSNASATLFITAPATQIGNTVEGFCQEVLASGILTIAVLALGDENNAPPGAGLGAIVLGFVVVAIGMSNGWISGYAINIARDLGPRLALWCLGYGIKLWHHDDWWWLAGAICGPVVGSIAGALAYDICIFTGPGSPVNYSTAEIINASGYPKMHNMVMYAFKPSYRRRRLSASRTQDPEELAETGMAPIELERNRTRQSRPGQPSQEKVNELALNHRLRLGKQKVIKRDEATRRREQQEVEERRRSIEELRRRERQRDVPDEEMENEGDFSSRPL